MRARRSRLAGLLALALLAPAAVGASRAPEDPRLQELRRRAREHRHDLSVRLELADLLGRSDDVERRREAVEVLEQATHIAPDSADIWARLARIQETRGFRGEARNAFRQALERAPARSDLWSELAQHELRWFQQSFVASHRNRSVAANERALALDGNNAEALHRAVRLAAFRGDEAALPRLAWAWREAAPADAWPLLTLGMLYARSGAWDRAAQAFHLGLARLPDAERRAFTSVAVVDPHAEEGLAAAADTARYEVDFWRWQDPTPADPLNPRLLEHYRRIVEAELYFGLDEMGVRGWDHAPGTMIVRYGIPRDWRFDRDVRRGDTMGGSFAFRTTGGFAPPWLDVVYGSAEYPIYFDFVDANLSGRHYMPVTGLLDDEDEFIAIIPVIYNPPFSAPEREQEIELWRFRDPEGRERLEVAVAVTPEAWPDEVLEAPYRLATAMTVYDDDWRALDSSVSSWAAMERDAMGRLIGRFVLEGRSDSLIVGLETQDRKDAGRGATYVTLAAQETKASLSELAFLSGVSFDASEPPYRRASGRALPNPGHLYLRGEPIGLAFQAYDMTTDAEGLHHARVRLSVGKPARRGFLNVLLGRGQEPPRAELAFDVVDVGTTLDAMYQVEVPDLDPGEYRMRVVVEDAQGGGSREGTARFQVLDRRVTGREQP